MKTINTFSGEFRFLSNFWPCYINYEGAWYPTTEHAYQAAKLDNPHLKEIIRNCPTPSDAKDYLTNNNITVNESWTREKKLSVMKELLDSKFSGRDPFLTRALLGTGDIELIEGNTWGDIFWGVCNHSGENNLGRLLMEIRRRLFSQKEEIIVQLNKQQTNDGVAKALGIPPRQLYEKDDILRHSEQGILDFLSSSSSLPG